MLIKGFCDVGRMDEARDLLDGIVNSNISLDVVTFGIVIDAFCKEGKMREAEELEIMMGWNIRPIVFVYNAVIDGYFLQGEMSKA